MKKSYNCPEFVYAGLKLLEEEIERVEWNIRQKSFEAPTHNNGGFYKTDIFEMRAYYWGECICDNQDNSTDCPVHLPNFVCEDFELIWYKYLGRGMEMNKNISANDFFVLIDKCLESIRKKDKRFIDN